MIAFRRSAHAGTAAPRRCYRLAVLAILLPLGVVQIGAQVRGIGDRITVQEGETDLGLIFNVGDILLDVESYQAGFGGKRRAEAAALRGLLDLVLSTSSGTWAAYPGLVAEFHLLDGPISPYLGAGLDFGIIRQRTETGPDDWSRTLTYLAGTGGILGVEVFLFDFLSVFAEYELSVDVSRIVTTTSVASAITETVSNDLTAGLGIGNEAKLGIVVYVRRRAGSIR